MIRRAVMLLALVLGVGLFVWWRIGSRPAPPEVPVIDVDHLHPLIADAVRHAVSRVEKEPRSAAAWGELGMLLIAHDMRTAARDCLEEAERLDPRDFRWPYFRGFLLADRDFEAALALYDRALGLRPDYIPLRLRIAKTLLRLGNRKRCRSLLEETRRIESGNPYVILMQGRLAIAEKDDPHAEKLFAEASGHPGWVQQSAYRELLKLAGRRGRFQQAYEYQRKLALLPTVERIEGPDPELAAIYRHFEALSKDQAKRADRALARGDLTTAVTEYESFLKKRSDLPTAYTNLAQAYALSNRYPEAIATYRKTLQRFGDVIAAHLGLATTYELAGQPELAVEQFRAALRLKPNHKQAWLQLGILHERQRRLDEALRCYERSATVDPSFAPAHLAWGTALLKQNRDEEARVHIARAVALAPGDPIPRGYLRTVDERLKKAKRGPAR